MEGLAEPIGGKDGDKYVALSGNSVTKIFNIFNPKYVVTKNVGGSSVNWLKDHKVLIGGDQLVAFSVLTNQVEKYSRQSPIDLVCVHPVEKNFYTYTRDDRLQLYDIREPDPYHVLRLRPRSKYFLSSLALRPGAHELVATTFDGRLLTWCLRGSRLRLDMAIGEHLLKCNVLGGDMVSVLDGGGSLHLVDVEREWAYPMPLPHLPRNNFRYHPENNKFISSFGRCIEVSSNSTMKTIDLSTYGEVLDFDVNCDGDKLITCHPNNITATYVESSTVFWSSALLTQSVREPQLSIIPFLP